MSGTNGAIKLVAGNSNPRLAEAIGAYLRIPLTKAVVRRFADMEIFVEILENVRGMDVFVVQSTSYPANDHLMELLIIIDALRRASARRITAGLGSITTPICGAGGPHRREEAPSSRSGYDRPEWLRLGPPSAGYVRTRRPVRRISHSFTKLRTTLKV